MKALLLVIGLALTMISATSMASDFTQVPCPYKTQTPGLRGDNTAFQPKPMGRPNSSSSSQQVETGS